MRPYRPADAIILRHIQRHGPWAPFTPQACLKFLTRNGATYTLVWATPDPSPADAPPAGRETPNGTPASANPVAASAGVP